ncbi:hypothetical protein WOLCODRAFT_101986 [Wolfiporia cocos MD-104 SS10]|uniref:Uncharacterized protein n=1 Tax=Wolfiporia cocos (strain MD-104) TaxID=742152 RepID=A0A2H3JJJ3_WOLCO|nr:hypothetical protein WOLCODRAFT_101986 [Wolfiporia cocos MD-104 SS10]
MVQVSVVPAGRVALARGLPITLSFDDKAAEDVTIGDVKSSLTAKFPRFYAARQKITIKGEKKALDDEATLAVAGIQDGGELAVKDLGPQINWRTVFLIEYAGPLLIHPLFYHFPRFWYGRPVPHSMLQKVVYALVLLHFVKRELETIFVHRFSHGTMPFMNIFKNSGHYWVLSGVLLAGAVYSPIYNLHSGHILGSVRNNPKFIGACTALWLFAELSNLHTHINVRNLRPAGTRQRAIPQGYGFELVSYPNYFFEIMAWVSIAAMTGSYTAWLFVAVSAYTMTVWALKKHKTYKKDFKDYPKNRKAIFPFLL